MLAFALYAAGEAVSDTDPDAAAAFFTRALEEAHGTGATFVAGVTSLSAATLRAHVAATRTRRCAPTPTSWTTGSAPACGRNNGPPCEPSWRS